MKEQEKTIEQLEDEAMGMFSASKETIAKIKAKKAKPTQK